MFGVILAAPQNKRHNPLSLFGFQQKPIRYKGSKSHEPIDLYHKTAKSQQIAAAFHLTARTAARHRSNYHSFTHTYDSPHEAAKNQWIGSTGGAFGGRVLNSVIDCHVCGKCNTALQQDANIEERSAKIMVLVQIMDNISVAKENLNVLLDKKVTMKKDRIIEAQFNETVLDQINSIRDTLVNAGEYLRGAARNILCH